VAPLWSVPLSTAAFQHISISIALLLAGINNSVFSWFIFNLLVSSILIDWPIN